MGICAADGCCAEAEDLEPKTIPLVLVALLVRTGYGLVAFEDAAECGAWGPAEEAGPRFGSMDSDCIYISISDDVGVCAFVDDPEGDEPSRRMFCMAFCLLFGDIGGKRCDFRFVLSIILVAHCSRSTGVRLAAWMNASDS